MKRAVALVIIFVLSAAVLGLLMPFYQVFGLVWAAFVLGIFALVARRIWRL